MVVFISDIVALAAFVGEQDQCVGSLMGSWGRGVPNKDNISRLMVEAVESGDSSGGNSYRDFITIFLNLGATVLF